MAFMLSTFNSLAAGEDFKSFLHKFTSSASFQYSLSSNAHLSRVKGKVCSVSPSSCNNTIGDFKGNLIREYWNEEEGGVYISRFTRDEPAYKEFEAGYDESEPSLRVVFELVDGNWYVTDCYNDWYNLDLPIGELEETVRTMQEENKSFEELHP